MSQRMLRGTASYLSSRAHLPPLPLSNPSLSSSPLSLSSFLSAQLRAFSLGRTPPLLSSSSSSSSPLSAPPSFISLFNFGRDFSHAAEKRGSLYADEMYHAWLQNPASVHKSWDAYFRTLGGTAPLTSSQAGALHSEVTPDEMKKQIVDHLKVQLLIRAYQVRGHNIANLDPLGINSPDLDPTIPPELRLESYGFTEADLDRKFTTDTAGLQHGLSGQSQTLTLREIINKLKSYYCGNIGFEYMHIPSRQQCNWLTERIEKDRQVNFSVQEKKVILDRLIWADAFERFVANKWRSERRFGLEGCEALIPGMKSLVDSAADLGAENIVIGMPHRGRLNVLANVVRKPFEAIFTEFSGSKDASDSFSGDVKYHLGMTFNRPTRSGKNLHLSLVANPSHLEACNPVVMGKVKAIQYFSEDIECQKSVAVLLHGDAAFAGQGVVYESLEMTDLPNYTTGGVIHLIVNNQIGFTTDPRFARSSPYCTDVAMAIKAPILHVNGDDPEAVVLACNLAAEWRSTFKKDVILDLICYRRHGHNEVDQPSFTQPLMYKKIEGHYPVITIYSTKLISEGTITEKEFQEMQANVQRTLEESYEKSKSYSFTPQGWTTSNWMTGKLGKTASTSLLTPEMNVKTVAPIYNTGVKVETLKELGKQISSYPREFNIHPGLEKIMAAKLKTIESGEGIDMPTAEALAFGTLLMEGNHVRLSGQDVERGTFSQRHAVLHDQENESVYIPLNNLAVGKEKQKEFLTVTNSHLSEYGVMGFELGYSLVNPNSLVIWEAQFGDFANTAQAIIDQFIASQEKKWLQMSGLVLSLPHGYDGAGPEHSSGRMERFLSLCDDHPLKIPKMDKASRRQIQDCNLQVVYPSTPANLFHALRRQVHRDFRKPLVLFFSKALLRHPIARSSLQEMGEGTRFRRVIAEPEDIKNPKRVIFCSGQVYYALLKARKDNNWNDAAIVRIEQISPFPFDKVIEIAESYPQAKMVWAQEEPMNAGAWSYVEPRFRTAFKATHSHKGREVSYAGRDPSASTATGNKKQHVFEEQSLIHQAFFGEPLKK